MMWPHFFWPSMAFLVVALALGRSFIEGPARAPHGLLLQWHLQRGSSDHEANHVQLRGNPKAGFWDAVLVNCSWRLGSFWPGYVIGTWIFSHTQLLLCVRVNSRTIE